MTNIWQVQFLRQVSLKGLTQDGFTEVIQILGNYVIFNRDILPEMLENVPLQVRQRLWFQHDGVPAHFALDVWEYLNNVFHNRWIGRVDPVQWPHVLPISLLWISLSGGDVTPEELVALVAEAAAIIRERQSFARRHQLCMNVNGRHFQQLL